VFVSAALVPAAEVIVIVLEGTEVDELWVLEAPVSCALNPARNFGE
jgi:hypothetical protein